MAVGKRAEVTVAWAGAVPVITMAGQVDLDCVDDVTAAFATAREAARRGDPRGGGGGLRGGANARGGGRIVVDVSRLEFADSTTLHVLLEARAASDLVLAGSLHSQVRMLFQVTDLLEVFHIADGLDEAIGTLDRAV